MKLPLNIDMAEATRLTRLGRLDEALAVLSGKAPETSGPATEDDGVIHMTPPSDGNGNVWTAPAGSEKPRKTRRPAGAMPHIDFNMPRADLFPGAGLRGAAAPGAKLPEGASFETHLFSNAAGQRPYKLYIPAAHKGKSLPLIIMLHGCTQSPDDFALGTRMNELAETSGFLVAYPGQTQAANAQKCWNWFNAGDQQRDHGEASIIAGLTREVMHAHDVDPQRVFVAGLSAGGAAAAILGATYPDLYAAVGVHSGLACGAAKDMPSAFAAMSQGAATGVKANGRPVPTIVFHGDSDKTVHARNGEQVLHQVRANARLQKTVTTGTSRGGTRFSRTVEADESGRAILEHWELHGAGHAWSGGNPSGSYTDPKGPDASAEMVRFFLASRP